MEILLLAVVSVFLLATPLFAKDSSDARAEAARPAAGWWPAAPYAR